MSQKRKIQLREFTEDIRRGMTNSQLMKKYQLSPRQCQAVFEHIETVHGSPEDLYGRTRGSDETDNSSTRRLPRHDIVLPLAVYKITCEENRGLVVDISEKGFKIHGIETRPKSRGVFAVLSQEIFDIGPIVLDAECRWVKRMGLHGLYVAGFQITDISPRNMKDLKLLISKVIFINQGRKDALRTGLEGVSPDGQAAVKFPWRCPACEMPQSREFEECPQCGIIVSKYLTQMDAIRNDLNGSCDRSERVTRRVSVPTEIWDQIDSKADKTNDVVTEALDFYLKSRKLAKSRGHSVTLVSASGL
ncbi:MAG: PilZ domain-containing protein [Pseudomonadota bacterium]